MRRSVSPASVATWLLVLGLAISIPIVVLGSVMVLRIMNRFPVVILLGAALYWGAQHFLGVGVSGKGKAA